MMNEKKILCIGEALIDMICTNKGKALSEGENFLKKPGGAPTNVAAAIAALGGKVALAAKVGVDPFGKQLIALMQQFGVDTHWMLQDKNYFTTMAFVSLMEDGERDFVFSRGADGQLCEADMVGIDVNDYGIVHFGSATAFLPGPLQQAYKALLLQCTQQNCYISFDPNYRHLLFENNTQSFIAQSWFFLEQCHFFKMSNEEALLISGADTLTEAISILSTKTNATFTITLGKDGAILFCNNTTTLAPTIPCHAVDTTGAGDAFVGALLYQLSNKSFTDIKALTTPNWMHLVTNANKAGAKTCEYLGAMEAFQHLSKTIFD